MYQGEGTPSGYEYPVPQTRAGASSVADCVGSHKELPADVLKQLNESARRERDRIPVATAG